MRELLTGEHFMTGNIAAAEGAIAAGCRFFAGYPITPSTEIAERISERFPEVGGIFIQMEDEIASMCAILGASWAGVKSMTATSGPGFSLMQENIGLGAMTETPCVIIDVQRGSPSTGLPTLVGQADVMQARWGSHGDYETIALAPMSPQECFDITITAFNLSEKYRVPTIVLMDECVGHMSERVVIPTKEKIEIINRKRPKTQDYLPYKADEKDLVPPMVSAGEGFNIHITGLTHNEKGYPVITAEAHEPLVKRLCDKIRNNAKDIVLFEEIDTKDAEIIVVAYGAVARTAKKAVKIAREQKLKVGFLRLITLWPFPEEKVRELSKKAKAFVVTEINYGQILWEVERCAKDSKTYLAPRLGGQLHTPQDILKKIKEAIK
ncbi:MAG: 2-oxoacid:acceptor oxidoreductase subunit alpha [Candidatus Thermoplasmatota archaeon]